MLPLYLKIIGGLFLAAFTCAGLKYYTDLISRTRADSARVLWSLIFSCTCILGPLVIWGVFWASESNLTIRLLGISAWVIPTWLYIVKNWSIINLRLRIREW